jgi:enamine deaminase RidA (YjgF/YER057c/UK114 family)
MATAFKKPNLSQSVSTPAEPIAETQSFDDLWSGEAGDEVSGETSEQPSTTDEQPATDEYPSQDPEALAEMTGEVAGEVAGEISPEDGVKEAVEEGSTPEEEWSETDQVELGPIAEPVVTTPVSAAIALPSARTALDDLLDQISNAHLDCTRAAAEVFHAESAVKSAKAEQKIAEERYKARVDVLMELTSKITHDSDRPLFPLNKPLPVAIKSATEATDVAPDSGQVGSDAAIREFVTGDHQAEQAEEALPDWQTITLAALEQHGVSAAVIEKLAESQINTLGELESLRAEISNGKAKWPKGIGEKKITAIENAVVTFLAAHQYSDSASVPVTQVDEAGEQSSIRTSREEIEADAKRIADEEGEEGEPIEASTDPTPEEWESMSHHQQLAWLNARAVYLETTAEEDDELEAIDVLDYRNTDSETEWQEGVDSYSEDDLASNCPYGPGENCDAWLQGWLWAGKQDTLDTNLPPKE